MTENNTTIQSTTFLKKIGDHAENKKLISRIITIIIFSIAVYEEFCLSNGIRDNWMELTKWCLLYYFGRSAAQKIAEYVSAANKKSNNV